MQFIIVNRDKNKEANLKNGNWRRYKEGVDEVLEQYSKLKKELKGNHELLHSKMNEWFNSLPKEDIRRQHKHYSYSDDRGLYFAADFAGPDDGRLNRPRYDIIHPITKKPC